MKSLSHGEREWFAGLAIEPKWDWSKKWPVRHLDMGSAQTTTVAELRSKWRDMLKDKCRRNGIQFIDVENPATAFKNVIEALAAKSSDGQMVLLIDEYDKPLLGHLMRPDVSRNSAMRSRRSTPSSRRRSRRSAQTSKIWSNA